MLNEQIVGFYAPMMFVLQGMGQVMSAVSEAVIPRLARLNQNNIRKFVSSSIKLAGLGFGIGVFGFVFSLFFGDIFLSFVYSPEYTQYTNVFVFMMGIGIVRFSLAGIGNSLTAAGLFTKQIPIFIVELLVTVISGYLLIPQYGLLGAAASTGLGIFSAFVLLVALLNKYQRKRSM